MNTMSSRERVLASINHQTPDRIPVYLGATPSSGISAIAYSNLIKHLEMNEYSQTIYGKRGGPFKPADWGVSTVNNGDWVGHSWAPAAEDKVSRVEIDPEGSEKVLQAIVFEHGKAVKSFEIQCLQGENWKTVYTGTVVGNGVPIELPGLTSQKVRLVINEFSSIPGIYEFIIL